VQKVAVDTPIVASERLKWLMQHTPQYLLAPGGSPGIFTNSMS